MLDWNILHARNVERTVLNAMHFLSVQTGKPPREIFRLMTAMCGGMYALFALWFVRAYGGPFLQKTMNLCLLLLAPIIWMFFGHMEIYAPAILLATSYGMTLLLFLNRPSRLRFAGLLLLLYLAIKAHTVNFLLAPSLLLALAWYLFRDSNRFAANFNWRKAGLFVIVLYALLGAVLYFLVLEDYKDTRVPGEHPNRYFLPLLTPEPPLHRYTLLSATHLLDFLNMLMLMSGAAVFVVVASFLFFRRRILWDAPDVLITGLTTALYMSFYFALNPLLGLPLDVDLFSLPAPFLILFSITLVRQLGDSHALRHVGGPVLALSLFIFPMLAVNSSAGLLVQRLESVGVRVFRTYWIGAGQPIWISLSLPSRSRDDFDARVDSVLSRVQPHAIQGSDVEYAEILRRIGERYRERFQQPEKALTYHEQAFRYDAGNRTNLVNLMDAYYLLGKFGEAYRTSQYLIAFRFPEYREALRSAIRCAIMAGKYEEARTHAHEYEEHWPHDGTMAPFFDRLYEDKPL
jgi:hypothetical protein